MESANPPLPLLTHSQQPLNATHAELTLRISKLLKIMRTVDSLLFNTIKALLSEPPVEESLGSLDKIKELELRAKQKNDFKEEIFRNMFPTEEELAYHKELLDEPHHPFSILEPKIRRGDPWSLKIPCVIGTVYTGHAYIDLQSLVNIMSCAYYNKIRTKSFQARINPYQPHKICNFVGRAKSLHVFVGCFVYVVNFMILEDLGSVIDGRLSEVVLGKPFVEASKLTYDQSLRLIRFDHRNNEVVFRMPQRTQEIHLISPSS
ncbi:hypothetical protein Tco_0438861 [Tanacetum coccineum]